MGPAYLIDSNALIDWLEGKLPPTGQAWMQQLVDRDGYALSVITRIEVLSPPMIQAERLAMDDFLDQSIIINLTELVVQKTIRIRQTHRCKLPDAVIAATALIHNLTLVTRNVADFRAIAGLTVINPHDPAALPTL